MSASITPAQAKYIGTLAEQLGYARVNDMWREYGYITDNGFGVTIRPCSKSAASDLISRLKARIESAS